MSWWDRRPRASGCVAAHFPGSPMGPRLLGERWGCERRCWWKGAAGLHGLPRALGAHLREQHLDSLGPVDPSRKAAATDHPRRKERHWILAPFSHDLQRPRWPLPHVLSGSRRTDPTPTDGRRARSHGQLAELPERSAGDPKLTRKEHGRP